MKGQNKGIWVVIGCAMAIFWPGALTFGFTGVMSTTWQQMFGVGRGATGNSLFFLLVAVGIFMFFVGKWQVKVGVKKMILIGTVICSLSVLFSAYATHIYFVYLWAFFNGIGVSFIYIPALTTVQLWYPSRKGLVSGIVNLIYGISAAIMSPIFSRMLLSVGYTSLHYGILYTTLAVGIVACLLADNLQTSGVQQQSTPSGEDKSLTVQEAVKTRSFRFLWLVWALQGAAGIAMVTMSMNFGLSRGFSLASAVMLLTTFNISNGLSRIVTGYFSDIIGRNRIMSITFILAGLAYFALPHTSALYTAAILATVIGFAFGTLFAVSAPLATECFGIKHFGAIYGLVFTGFGFFAGLLGPSLGGYVLDMTGSNFIIVFYYLGIFSIFSSILIRYVVPAHASQKDLVTLSIGSNLQDSVETVLRK